MAYRVSFIFQQDADEDGGWSVNLHNTLTNVTAVATSAYALRAKLMGFVGGGCYCNEIRAANMANARDVAQYPFYGSNPPLGNSTTDANFQNVAVLLKLATSQGNSVSMWVKGVPMNCLQGGGRLALTPTSQLNMNAVTTELENPARGWACYCQDRTIPRTGITAATSAGVVTAPGHGLTGTNTIKVSRTTGIVNLNNTWKCSVIDNNNVQLQMQGGKPLSGAYTGGGSLYLLFSDTFSIADAIVSRASSRKTGRPSRLLSGRRKTRKA